MVSHKTVFLEKFQDAIRRGEIKSICDLGSGESRSFLPLLEKFPSLQYVGLEPSRPHFELAKKILSPFPNARVFNAAGYQPLPEFWGSFDLVVSLSVLEHVKDLPRFIKNSAAAARSGGLVVHRWDLGHALHPSSLKEHFQVFLGDHLPFLLPELKFVCTLLPSEVRGLFQEAGLGVDKIDYSQMPDHKSFLKRFRAESPEAEALARELIGWEERVGPHLESLPEIERLKLFPTVTLWGRRV